jgi:hypothetical protein
MIDPFAIAKMINPNCDDVIEKKKLKEHDEVRKGEVTIFPHKHGPTITLTNGSIVCLVCYKLLHEVKPKWKKEE